MYTDTEAKEKLSVSLPPVLIRAIKEEAIRKYPQKRGGGNMSKIAEMAEEMKILKRKIGEAE